MEEVSEIKKAISRKVNRMVGYEVIGLGDLLSILTGPDVLPDLERLIQQIRE